MQKIALIPARLDSSRLPRKALLDIEGLPMIVHVARRAMLAGCFDQVVVCSDSPEIIDVCLFHSVDTCVTSDHHINGTERIAEAAELLGLGYDDVIVDIQGDEPLVSPSALKSLIEFVDGCAAGEYEIILPHLIGVGAQNENIVKVVASGDRVLYLTRADSPYAFNEDRPLLKHLSTIIFTGSSLKKFSELEVGQLEKVEGIELLRALEGGMEIKTVCVDGNSFSVDVPADLEKARRAIARCPWFLEGY